MSTDYQSTDDVSHQLGWRKEVRTCVLSIWTGIWHKPPQWVVTFWEQHKSLSKAV